MSEPIFRREGDAFVPTAHALGPWDPGQLHGGAPGALIAQALLDGGLPGRSPDVRLPRPGAAGPLTVERADDQAGPQPALAEAELCADGQVVLRARAVRLRRATSSSPRSEPAAAPAAQAGRRRRSRPRRPRRGLSPHRHGDPLLAGTDYGRGPARAWFRLAPPADRRRAASPLARVLAAADFGNGVSRILDFEHYLFVNTDLTVHLHREPRGSGSCSTRARAWRPHGAGLARSAL